MTPVERLQAAIDKLEALKEASTLGPWVLRNGTVMFAATFGLSPVLSTLTTARTDADLIVTLHRTIDAQLAILKVAASDYEGISAIEAQRNRFFANDLALADAVLGGTA